MVGCGEGCGGWRGEQRYDRLPRQHLFSVFSATEWTMICYTMKTLDSRNENVQFSYLPLPPTHPPIIPSPHFALQSNVFRNSRYKTTRIDKNTNTSKMTYGHFKKKICPLISLTVQETTVCLRVFYPSTPYHKILMPIGIIPP